MELQLYTNVPLNARNLHSHQEIVVRPRKRAGHLYLTCRPATGRRHDVLVTSSPNEDILRYHRLFLPQQVPSHLPFRKTPTSFTRGQTLCRRENIPLPMHSDYYTFIMTMLRQRDLYYYFNFSQNLSILIYYTIMCLSLSRKIYQFRIY